eukprot:TRINITY_DN3507_c0_g1_i1.p1 TRINITY_DN3507_c0_g1~~TRINITY_DN3507_c0_g1_i1.p1  ORF type:complete len:686 (+),score=169.06 TRINITY_DN3507_c0_g1_i1:75-2132(+)
MPQPPAYRVGRRLADDVPLWPKPHPTGGPVRPGRPLRTAAVGGGWGPEEQQITPPDPGLRRRLAPAPIISPDGGPQSPRGHVTIRPPPELPADTRLRFTTDGTDPGAGSEQYCAPVPLRPLATQDRLEVRAICDIRGMTPQVAAATFTRRSHAPPEPPPQQQQQQPQQLLPPRWSVRDGERLQPDTLVRLSLPRGAAGALMTADGSNPLGQGHYLYRGPFRLGCLAGPRGDEAVRLAAVSVADGWRPSVPAAVGVFVCAPRAGTPPPQPRPHALHSLPGPAVPLPAPPAPVPAPVVRVVADPNCRQRRVLIGAYCLPPAESIVFRSALDPADTQPTPPAASGAAMVFPSPGPLPVPVHDTHTTLVTLVARTADGRESHPAHVAVPPIFVEVRERPAAAPPRSPPRADLPPAPDMELLIRVDAACRDFSAVHRQLSAAHADPRAAAAAGAGSQLMVGAEQLHASCVLVICCLAASDEGDGVTLPADDEQGPPLSPLHSRHFREAGDLLVDIYYFALLDAQRLGKEGGAAAHPRRALDLAGDLADRAARACAAVRAVARRLRCFGPQYADAATDALPLPSPARPGPSPLELFLAALLRAAADAERRCGAAGEGQRAACAEGMGKLGALCSAEAAPRPDAAPAAAFFARAQVLLSAPEPAPPPPPPPPPAPPTPVASPRRDGHVVFDL